MSRKLFKKALNHIESRSCDSNISRLNDELKKTGMLSEKMTTSTVLPPTETQPYIPPTTSNVPDTSGLLGNSFSQPTNGGDTSDPSTWQNGWPNNDYLKNPNDLSGETDIPILAQVNATYPYDDGGGTSTIVFGSIAFGTSVGVISSDNIYRQILVGGLIGGTNRPTEESRGSGGVYRSLTDEQFNYAVAVYEKYSELNDKRLAGELESGVVYVWKNYSRFHDGGGSFEGYTGVKKSTAEYPQLILIGIQYFKEANTYTSDPGQPRTIVLNRLDDPSSPDYYEGDFSRFLANLLDVGKQAFDYLQDQIDKVTEDAREEKHANLGEVAGKLSAGGFIGLSVTSLLGIGGAVQNYVSKDVDNGLENSVQLATKLLASIISGKPQEIVLGDKGKKEQISSVDSKKFEEILTVGGAAPKPGADSTVNPQNKGPLLTGSWGTQGGSEVHYDPKNDTLTITSEKMLRTTSGGNTVETDSSGKIVSFSDIPEPTVQDVETLAVDALTGDYEHLLDIVMGTAGAISNNITNPNTEYGHGGQYGLPASQNQMTWDQIKENDPEAVEELIRSSAKPLKGKEKSAADFIQGTASNAVAVREVLKKLGAPESEVEKTGGGYGQVYSQTEYTGDEIPENLRGILNKKTGVKESFTISEGWQSPDHTNVEKDSKTRWFNPNAGTDSAKWFDPKEVKPAYPAKAPPKMIDGYSATSNLAPKPVDKSPAIKLTKKDLLRNYRLKDSEVAEMMQTIDRINKFIADHPEELIYAKSRYPKHDPRLAELNWNMDQMLKASGDYLDKQFPENERLFARIQNSIVKNIKATDPEEYKEVISTIETEKKARKIKKSHLSRKVSERERKSAFSRALKHLPTEARVQSDVTKERIEEIAKAELEYLKTIGKPKYYDWKDDGFDFSENFEDRKKSIHHFHSLIDKRIENLENALEEGMTTSEYIKQLYGEIPTITSIMSIDPNLLGSKFAQDVVQDSEKATTHAYGSYFPGSYVNSIGDFNPQSYSKVDVLATASWNSIQDVTPPGWTPDSSYEYSGSVSDVVTAGQESDVFKDTHFGEVTVNGTNFSLSTGDDEDSSQENTVDILDLESLFPGVTFPTAYPMPGETEREDPIEGSMLLRTFKSIKVGQEITFNYSFTSTETEEDNDVTYRGATREVPGDDAIMDDYAFVLIAGRVQKIVSVMARDGNNINFNFQPNADDIYKPDVLQSRFPLTGRYRYTVKQDDIDDHGNLKLFVGVMDSGDAAFESNLDITNFQIDGARLAAGQLGKTTDAYDLGTSVASLDPNEKKKKDSVKFNSKKLVNKFGNQIGNELAKIYQRLSTFKSAGITFANFLLQQQGMKNYTEENPYNVKLPEKDAQAIADTFNELLRTKIPRERWNNLNQEDMDLINKTLNPTSGPTPTNRHREGSSPNEDEYHNTFNNLGNPKGIKVKVTKDGEPYVSELGDNFVFENDADASVMGAPALIKFFSTAGGAQDREDAAGGGEYTYKAGGVFSGNVDDIKPPTDLKMKNMPIRLKLPPPSNFSVNEELYPGQPSPNGFPDTPPPKLAPNGYHPEYGKKADRYRRLDPVSAVMMRKVGTDDPKTNKQVSDAVKKPK